jgi:putative lipoic acid-binding regulatory protein
MAELNFDELRKKLEKESWPAVYMFKFIVPSDNHKIALIESFFEDDAEIHTQPSSNGKYTSITIRQVMLEAESIVEVYKQAAVIEGIISL